MCGPLSLDDSISIEESHRLIDEAILRHQASILALKSQKNSLMSISRLPPEILCRIFWEVKKEVQLNSHDLLPACIKWIEVTHVCSHWRHVAINSAGLWVDPPLGNLRWVQEMLQRSKDAGLVIKADLNQESIMAITPGFMLALKHSSRIKHLSLEHVYDSIRWNNLRIALPRSAPQLEYFRFTGLGDDPWNSHPGLISSFPVVFSEKVLCEAERLRHLVLSKCNSNWTSHPSFLRSLTHLTLHQLTLESRPTGKQFMDALKAMPDLQALDIKDGLPVEQTWVTDQIHLASLRVLSIHSLYTEVENFFRCVTFPPTAKVTVECAAVGLSSIADADFAGIITNVSRSYSNPTSDTAFHTLLYRPPSSILHGPIFKLFRDAVAGEQIAHYKSVTVADLELAFDIPTQLPEQLITKLLTRIFSGSLPLQDVIMHTELTWAETDLLDLSEAAKTIANTLGNLPQMRSLLAGRYTSIFLLKALQFGSQIGSSDPMEKLCFPNLSMICFNGSKFANLALSDSSQDPAIISIESLKECLIQRSKYGTKLKNLTLKFCRNFGEREAHSLSHFVDVIDWDQREAYGDSEDDDDEEEDYEAEEIYSDYDDNYLSDL